VSRKKKGRDPILVAVLAEVGAGGITEGWISHKTHYIKGMCQFPGGSITINPAYDVVETLIHEIVHRIRPQWTERYVRRTTTVLMRQLSDQEIVAVHEQYQRRKRVRRAPKAFDVPLERWG
jgi:hypothetical protein